MPSRGGRPDPKRLDKLIEQAQRKAEARANTCREQALTLLPWVCAKCARTFDRSNIRELSCPGLSGPARLSFAASREAR